MRIVCLEQGDWVRPNHDPSSRRVWEPHRYGDFAAIPIRSDLPADYPINDDGSPIRIVNVNGVGGSTVMCMGHFPRLHPSDFKVRALDGVADDWPIDYDTLEPFYAENDRMMGVSGLAGDPAYPPKQPPMPLLPLGESGSRLAEAMNRLGWHWWPSDATIASTDIAYWPHAIRAGVELRTACRVREISLNEHGMASGVVYYDRDSNEHFQGAEIVVIACNGVGTPRLMLNSISGKFPNGIANSSGLVGKNLMLHPNGHAYGCVDDPMDNRGPPLCLTSQEFYETDPSRDFVRGYALQFGLGLPSILETIVLTANGRLPWGEDHHRLYRHMKGHRVGIAVICEDLPEEHNRVTLDPVLKDSNGIPAPESRLYLRSEQPKDASARCRLCEGNSRCSRRPRRRLRSAASQRRLRSSRHSAHGSRSGTLGGERMGAMSRREKPVHRGWEYLGDVGRREPNLEHPGAGPLYCRRHQAAPRCRVHDAGRPPSLARNGLKLHRPTPSPPIRGRPFPFH
jgi:choline dehydrogenase-like flavoprotein